MLARHFSRRTIKVYLYWIKGYIVFNNKRHPIEFGESEVEAFLTYLSVKRHVAPAHGLLPLIRLCFYTKTLSIAH
nr:phage integrase N-terminal SAM-like domain-containing protein [Exilibacterium tricleocarpae]